MQLNVKGVCFRFTLVQMRKEFDREVSNEKGKGKTTGKLERKNN